MGLQCSSGKLCYVIFTAVKLKKKSFSNVLDDHMVQKPDNNKNAEFDDFFGQYDNDILSTF